MKTPAPLAGLFALLAMGLPARGAEYPNPLDYNPAPVRRAAPVASASAAPAPSPAPAAGGWRFDSRPPAVPPAPSVPGAVPALANPAASAGGFSAGTGNGGGHGYVPASPSFAVERLILRQEEMEACYIMLQRELSAGRDTEMPFLHLRNLYSKLSQTARPLTASGADFLSPMSPANPDAAASFPAAAPRAVAAGTANTDPRAAIGEDLRARLAAEPGARPIQQDLAFHEMFMGNAERAMQAWEAAGPESDDDLQYRLVHALLSVALERAEDGAGDLEDALRLLDRRRGLALRNGGFVTQLMAFRDFTPRPRQPFRPGEPYFLYFELERVAFRRFQDEYGVNVRVALSILDGRDRVVWSDGDIGLFTKRYRFAVRDVYIGLEHKMPDLPPGAYRLAVHARDQHVLKDASLLVPFEIRGNAAAGTGTGAAGRAAAAPGGVGGADDSGPRIDVFRRVPRPPEMGWEAEVDKELDAMDAPEFFDGADASRASEGDLFQASAASSEAPGAASAAAGAGGRPAPSPSAEYRDFQKKFDATERYHQQVREELKRQNQELDRRLGDLDRQRQDLDRRKQDFDRLQNLQMQARQQMGSASGSFF